ncbi:ABC transporter ATP-binding protein [Peptostreptococcus canis]|uniref:ABC transporter ATP-binding protein n=1 Tax=Peptostreptococcus canis TaxID=1159213 RepID=A0ABR6TNQ4_9FIRM|nr:ABC transporter ATP-binding protein [Peptostreptococcus canis]MBC2576804.1 ABC transporter ATP-binding protein [Peptostreptococcus canis]MBP1998874.1 ATP-binding cassette subfamily B protein [Peptostreptococcus canis]
MIEYLINRFGLTRQGAIDMRKATISSFATYSANMIPAILLMIFIDGLLTNNLKSSGFYITFSLISIILIYIALNIEYEALYNSTYKESANLRTETAKRLSILPLSYFSKNDLSDLAQTIMSDIEAIEHAMSHSIPKIGGFFIFFPIISILMLIGNVKLGLAVILPTILSIILVIISKKVQIKGNEKYYGTLRENSEAFQETIELQQEIKSFNLSEDVRKTLYEKMDDSERIHMKSEKSLMYIIGLSRIVSSLSLAVVILVGISLFSNNEISILYLLGYLLAAMKIKDIVDASSELIAEVYYLDPRIKRIKEIRESEIQKGKEQKINKFDIDLKNVSFSYDKQTNVLDNITFTANQGQVTALVGVSGCGKTSILRLISRLYDYDKGKIEIDGIDIKSISTKSLFENISIVFQEVTLFNTSILENIRIGRKNATDEEVKNAARLANCEEFINKLDKGYDTFIGENGAELSGGERQRLSIARAFLKNSPILILDEISSSLDVENEKKIQESLSKLIKDKTVIIISHRLKAVENVDKIVVIDKGVVESQGTHVELKEKSKVYKNLLKKSNLAEEFVY